MKSLAKSIFCVSILGAIAATSCGREKDKGRAAPVVTEAAKKGPVAPTPSPSPSASSTSTSSQYQTSEAVYAELLGYCEAESARMTPEQSKEMCACASKNLLDVIVKKYGAESIPQEIELSDSDIENVGASCDVSVSRN